MMRPINTLEKNKSKHGNVFLKLKAIYITERLLEEVLLTPRLRSSSMKIVVAGLAGAF